MAQKAAVLKEEGNNHFGNGKYREAETCYTQAIQRDPTNPKLFTNRAMARIKLELWDPCINDCIKSIELDRGNMKGFFLLSQAQLALKHPNEALTSALTAYEKCIETLSPSTSAVSALVLKAKKERWEAKERERLRRKSDMLRELEDLISVNMTAEIQGLKAQRLGPHAEAEERAEIEAIARHKIDDLRSIFAIADPQNMTKREVPDYLIDSISFVVMHDPVTTNTGNSYDRSTVIEHLKRSQTDPLTREPLSIADLRPNLALKQACEEFLAENGWAVDY